MGDQIIFLTFALSFLLLKSMHNYTKNGYICRNILTKLVIKKY